MFGGALKQVLLRSELGHCHQVLLSCTAQVLSRFLRRGTASVERASVESVTADTAMCFCRKRRRHILDHWSKCAMNLRKCDCGILVYAGGGADLVQEVESMDKNGSHVLSPELGGSTKPRTTGTMVEKGQPLRNEWLEQRETRRRKISPAGLWKRTESRQNFWKEEENPRGDREGIHQGRHPDVKRGHGRIGWISVIVKVQTSLLQAISEWERFAERKRDGTVRRYDRPCKC